HRQRALTKKTRLPHSGKISRSPSGLSGSVSCSIPVDRRRLQTEQHRLAAPLQFPPGQPPVGVVAVGLAQQHQLRQAIRSTPPPLLGQRGQQHHLGIHDLVQRFRRPKRPFTPPPEQPARCDVHKSHLLPSVPPLS